MRQNLRIKEMKHLPPALFLLLRRAERENVLTHLAKSHISVADPVFLA